MPSEVKAAIKSIGLSDKEVLILFVLFKNGSMLATSIAEATKLNRTTTYGLLKDLAAKGLVSSSRKKEKATRYQSISPEMFPDYIERRRDELTKSKKIIEDALPQMLLLRTKGKVLPHVQYFEGARGVEQAYEDMLQHNKEKMIYALTGLEGAVTSLDPKFQDYFIGKRTKMGIKAEYIVPETAVARQATMNDREKLRHAKFIPPQFNFNTEICMYDTKVSILSYALENPIALIIEDETISYAMKQIFNYIHSTAKNSESPANR
jgi:sugar-specific transcriptional regulator TrmB